MSDNSLQSTKVSLDPRFFSEKKRPFLETGALRASLFLYDSGVAAVQLENGVSELVMLPFQGQQIWSATFGGRNVTMKSMFDQPRPTSDYLQTYGGFLLHCGLTAMGVPTDEDDHPLHGELPNAQFQHAWLVSGEDEGGAYIGLGGRYQHTVAFADNYTATPLVKLHAGAKEVHVSLCCRNCKKTPMEYMYLAHANFKPVDGARIVYSAKVTPQTVRVRRSIPGHISTGPEYLDFLDRLGERPEEHHVFDESMTFIPELVFSIDYDADDQGWAHTLQVHPDGCADYVRHRPDQLPIGVRWICRTPDKDALGLVLPSTAEPEGKSAEMAKGNVRELEGGGEWRCDYVLGTLDAADVGAVEEKIAEIG
ncbi:MAG: DUF4432 family protein [Caldilineaceae bacterium]|nr:DUF4432 family protein [Caldilineaceae bacterium]